MRRLLVLGLALGLFACMTPTPSAEEVKLETEDQKMLYAVGQALSRNIAGLKFTEDEMKFIELGLRDGATGSEAKVDMMVFGPKLDPTLRSRVQRINEEENQAGLAYCEEQAKAPGAEKLASGMVFQSLAEGEGASPAITDTIKVHYHGTLRDGKVFDSTRDKEPAQFAVNGVIPCFSEGLQKIKVGGKARLTCPSNIAYGERGSPPNILPGAALTFEIELLEIVGQPAAAPAADPVP